MIRFVVLTLACSGISGLAFCQTNIIVTNALADAVLHGNYSPVAYQATQLILDPSTIAGNIQATVCADSLRKTVETLSKFQNRNTGSDTVSQTKGIGAARRWAFDQFLGISQANENRLLPSYLQFDRAICGATQHRNVLAVLPGMDTSAKGFVLIEAHLDSRCTGNCDTACVAQGADDNASGCAMVLELARVMSGNTYRRTVVFMLTTAEEQGLYGAEAMSDYCRADSIPIHAVLNNDVVGGVICGATSSAPSCPGSGNIDSLNLRLFSFGGFNSLHKQLARYAKLQYQEMLLPHVAVPMTMHIMTAEDRTGRGGDHIPFRQGGFKAMRFTSANEHGNASNAPGYTDHQHTSADSIGIDRDFDGEIDSLWLDFHYLARNTAINANAASMIALGPETPEFTAALLTGNQVEIAITSQLHFGRYRVGLRTISNDWDSVYTILGTIDTLTGLPVTSLIVSVASLDSTGVESLFSHESLISIVDAGNPSPLHLLQNHPNPFDEATRISVRMDAPIAYNEAHISIANAAGLEIEKIPITLEAEVNEVIFQHGFHAKGVFYYSLMVDGKKYGTGKMVMQ